MGSSQSEVVISEQTWLILQIMVQAASDGDEGTVTKYIDAGGNVNVKSSAGNTALIEAAQHGHAVMCRLLLRHGADVNTVGFNGCTALMKAASGGHIRIVRLLLEHGADPRIRDHYGWTAQNLAKQSGHSDIATLIGRWSHQVHSDVAMLSPSHVLHRVFRVLIPRPMMTKCYGDISPRVATPTQWE